MKFPISWHESSVRARAAHLADAEAELSRQLKRVQTLRDQLSHSQRQLDEAKRRGLDGYDPDRFMRTR